MPQMSSLMWSPLTILVSLIFSFCCAKIFFSPNPSLPHLNSLSFSGLTEIKWPW